VSTSTTTIRVPVQTRDRLAAQARERGVSIAALLTELATRAEHEAIFRAERDATRAEAALQAVHDENRDWDTTVGDGIG
jgi:post-segregation antitoxin (ccd killing protein)